MITNDELKINTIYIISKGRPQCTTARTLTRIKYPGEWFIVVGNNDDTLQEYIDAWGERVIVFDWYEQITRNDTYDNFGYESKGSGATPVRNAVREISESRGEKRHWQLDDDYHGFSRYDGKSKKNKVIKDGGVLFSTMYRIAKFGFETSMQNVGFCISTAEAIPSNRKNYGKRIFNAHNMPSNEELFMPWKGRMNDDTIHAINVWRHKGYELQVKYLHMGLEKTQKEAGGLTEMYVQDGTVRKTAYVFLVAPNACKLVIRYGRYHHQMKWNKIAPKLIREEWKRCTTT